MLKVGNDPFITPTMCSIPCIITNYLVKTLNQNSFGNCMNNFTMLMNFLTIITQTKSLVTPNKSSTN